MRKEVIGNATLYLGDCLDILPTLDKVDAVITDPPYELSDSSPGKHHYGMSLGKFESQEFREIVSGFDIIKTFNLLGNICSPFNMFCFCSNKQISKIMSYHEDLKRSTNLLIWHKPNAAPFANGVWRGDAEFCIHAKEKGAYFEGNARLKTKITTHPIVVNSDHPTVKPTVILEKYIKIGTDIEHTVIDPFMGSGTTGVACMNLNRKFIGIEIDENYFNIACERIDQAQRQGRLFE